MNKIYKMANKLIDAQISGKVISRSEYNFLKTTEEALQWVSDNLHPKVAKASSFGAEDAVVMDIMLKINPNFRFFTLDTGRLPQ